MRVDTQFLAWIAKYEANELVWRVMVPFPPPVSDKEIHHGTDARFVDDNGVVYAGGSAYRSEYNSVRA